MLPPLHASCLPGWQDNIWCLITLLNGSFNSKGGSWCSLPINSKLLQTMSFLNNVKANELHFHEPRWNPPWMELFVQPSTTHTVCDNAQTELVIFQVGEVKGPRTLLSGSTPLISPWPALWVLLFPDRSHSSYSPAPACSCSNPSPADLSGWTTWCTCRRGSSGSRPSHTCLAGGPSSRGNGSADRRGSELRSHLLAVTKQNEERINTLRDSHFASSLKSRDYLQRLTGRNHQRKNGRCCSWTCQNTWRSWIQSIRCLPRSGGRWDCCPACQPLARRWCSACGAPPPTCHLVSSCTDCPTPA